MVESIGPIGSEGVHGAPQGKPVSADDVAQLQKLHAQIETLKQVQSVAQTAAKQQLQKSRQQPLTSSLLPPGLQQAYKTQMGDMLQFIQMLKASGNKSWAPLLQVYENDVKGMSNPPTSAEAAQLNVIMQTLNSFATKLPQKGINSFFKLEVNMYTSMLTSTQAELNQTNAQVTTLEARLKVTLPLAKLLEQGASAAQAISRIQSSSDNVSPFLNMGESIIGLLNLQKKLPANSPYAKIVQQAIASWNQIGSKDPRFSSGAIMGYSLFMAEATDYANGPDGTQKDIGQVMNYLTSINTQGAGYLSNAVSWIEQTFPKGFEPHDWSYQGGKVVMNYISFKSDLRAGMSTSAINTGKIANALNALYNPINTTNITSQAEIATLKGILAQLSPYITTFSKNLSFAQSQIKDNPHSGSYLQKALLPLINTEVQKLHELLLFLEKYAPGTFSGTLQGYDQTLGQIVASFPNLTQGDLNSLTSILGGMNQIANSLPAKSYKASFWNTESELYATLSNIGKATHDNDLIIFQKMQNMQGIVKRWQAGTFSPQDFQMMLADVQALMQNGQVLSYGDSPSLESFLQNLGMITGAPIGRMNPSSANLENMIVISMQYSIVQKYIQTYGSGASMAGLQAYVNGYVNNLPITSSPYLQQVEQKLSDISPLIKTPSNPNPVMTLATLGGKTMTLNPELMSTMTTGFLKGGLVPSGGNWNNLLASLRGATNQFNPTKNGLDAIQNMINGFDIARGIAEAKADGVDSLADLFATDVINRYMPEQQAMLSALGLNMKFDNQAGGMDQAILTLIKNFASAGSNFSFSSLLSHGSTKGSYPGNAKTAQKLLDKEKKAAKHDISALNKSITQIDQDIATLTLDHDYDGDPVLLAEKGKMIERLKGYKANMQKAIGQVSQVLSDLANAKITGSKDGKSFSVSGITGDLAVDEHNAVYGQSSDTPPGGLSKIQSTIRGDMQDYTSKNTTEQYNMELIMTKVQQEWSLTSTCISTLNQSYMTFARAIHK